jgi:hypothetical protein
MEGDYELLFAGFTLLLTNMFMIGGGMTPTVQKAQGVAMYFEARSDILGHARFMTYFANL